MRIYWTPQDGLGYWLRQRGGDAAEAAATESGLGKDGVDSILAGEYMTPSGEEIAGVARALDCPSTDIGFRGVHEITETREEKGETRTSVVASNDNVARDGDVVESSTLNLDHYRRNPVVLWAHRHDLHPIGKGTADADKEMMSLDILWDEHDDNEMGRRTARQFRNGYLSAVSLGWVPTELVSRNTLGEDHPHYGPAGFVHRHAEVLEVSAVPVPSLREALVVQRSIGGHAEPMPKFERSTLLEWLQSDPQIQAIIVEMVERAQESPLDTWFRRGQ